MTHKCTLFSMFKNTPVKGKYHMTPDILLLKSWPVFGICSYVCLNSKYNGNLLIFYLVNTSSLLCNCQRLFAHSWLLLSSISLCSWCRKLKWKNDPILFITFYQIQNNKLCVNPEKSAMWLLLQLPKSNYMIKLLVVL